MWKDPNVYPSGLKADRPTEIIANYDERQSADLATDLDHRLIENAEAAPTVIPREPKRPRDLGAENDPRAPEIPPR